MPPNTVHFVLGTRKSLLTGSNLFLPENWFDSLTNILLTHMYGQTISFSAYIGMHVYAFHQVEFYLDLVNARCTSEAKDLEKPDGKHQHYLLIIGIFIGII